MDDAADILPIMKCFNSGGRDKIKQISCRYHKKSFTYKPRERWSFTTQMWNSPAGGSHVDERTRSRKVPRYLLCDNTGTFDELPLSEAVRGSDLQSSSLLDQEDAAVPQILHPVLNLETNLGNTQ